MWNGWKIKEWFYMKEWNDDGPRKQNFGGNGCSHTHRLGPFRTHRYIGILNSILLHGLSIISNGMVEYL